MPSIRTQQLETFAMVLTIAPRTFALFALFLGRLGGRRGTCCCEATQSRLTMGERRYPNIRRSQRTRRRQADGAAADHPMPLVAAVLAGALAHRAGRREFFVEVDERMAEVGAARDAAEGEVPVRRADPDKWPSHRRPP
jgi:hypothetical protein